MSCNLEFAQVGLCKGWLGPTAAGQQPVHTRSAQYRDKYTKTWRHTARCGCGFVIPLTVVGLFTCMVLVGAFLSSNIAAADLCFNPDVVLSGVLEGSDQRFAQLYMYCTGEDAAALVKLAQDSTAFTQVCLHGNEKGFEAVACVEQALDAVMGRHKGKPRPQSITLQCPHGLARDLLLYVRVCACQKSF